MNAPHDNELLSAYLDGELTAKDRESVEERLQVSADLRRELHEYREVSNRIRELPRQTLDSGFASQVMREIGRRVPMAVGSPQPPSHKRGGSTAVIGGLLTTAAALMVMSLVARSHSPQNPSGSAEVAHRSDAKPEAAPSSVANAEGNKGDQSKVEVAATNVTDAAAASASSTGNSSVEKRPTQTISRSPTGFHANSRELVKPRIGDFVDRVLRTEDGKVSVVRMMVVDEGSGIRLVQKIFADHAIILDPAQNEDIASQAENLRTALVVVASGEQLLASFNEIHSQAGVTILDGVVPVDVNRLDPAVKDVVMDRPQGSRQSLTRVPVSSLPVIGVPVPKPAGDGRRTTPASVLIVVEKKALPNAPKTTPVTTPTEKSSS